MNFRYDPTSEKLIVSQATRTEYHQVKIWLERHVKGYKFLPAVKMGVWNGKQSYFDNGKVNLGLWKECFLACKEVEVPFIIDNKEDFPINRNITLDELTLFCQEFFAEHKVKDKKTGEWKDFNPYDYQIETAYKILKNRYCMAEVATSGGKSLIISIIIFYILNRVNPDAKFLIIVPSITLVTQFYDEIKKFYWSENKIENPHDWAYEIELSNGKIFQQDPSEKIMTDNRDVISADDLKVGDLVTNQTIKRITKIKIVEPIRLEEIMSDRPRKPINENPNIYISTYQSLEKYPKEFFQQFHTVTCDEAHGCKSATLLSILKKTFGYAYNRFGVSGTFPSDDTLEILSIQSVLGPKVTQIEAKKLVELGTITPMKIKAVILNHNLPDINERINYIKKMGAGSDAFRIEKQFIQESEKRLDFIKKIVEKCSDNTLLLFQNIEYGKKIFEKLKAEVTDKDFYYIDGEVNNKNRNIIKAEMDKTDGNVKVLVASYLTLGTGVSITAIFNVIFADSYKSEQIVIQSIGRALRKHSEKKVATIFDLVDVFDPKDMNNILYRHFKEREKFYKSREYPYSEIKINL
jgi:superfamily II DNA or RNA helicase